MRRSSSFRTRAMWPTSTTRLPSRPSSRTFSAQDNPLCEHGNHDAAAAARGDPQRVRELCLAFPETSERLSHGAPTFFVRDKRAFLIILTNHHNNKRFAIWCAAAAGMQEMLVDADPERFFRPPYVGHRGWLGVRLDRGLD